MTDAAMESRQNEVAKYFGVENQWNQLNDKWIQKQEAPTGYKRYYELLFLIKSESKKDHIWVRFFEGMHCHAAIVWGLLCLQFDFVANELNPGSLPLEKFKTVKNFKYPETTVGEHLDKTFSLEYEAPMFHTEFIISAYVPMDTNIDASQLIMDIKLQEKFSNQDYIKTTLTHTTRDTRNNLKFHPALGKNGHHIKYQDAATVESYNKKISKYDGKDKQVYEYPSCFEGPIWDAYIRNPFDLNTRKNFLNTISLPCIDGTKSTKMNPPYAITFQHLTTDVGPVGQREGRKIDARHYNG